ncbi:MAG TPA: hypothetical protein VK540_20265 [Polyangiaceae bacterium]|nr:hypothetical protein [Polyangiaceae bacterium]
MAARHEIVRVGTKAVAFWVDRYEASVWEFSAGTGTSYGASISDYPIPITGQLGTGDLGFAISKASVLRSTYVSWFQADVFCRASGKRLPTSGHLQPQRLPSAQPRQLIGWIPLHRTALGRIRPK